MSIKSRTSENSRNLILNMKLSTYGAYKGLNSNNNDGSFKKMESLNLKIFDRARKKPRILSRNDRMDLFLEGGNFSQNRRNYSKCNEDCNERSFYKMTKMKKKSEIFGFLRNQLNHGWNTHNFTSHHQAKQTNILRSSQGTRKSSDLIKAPLLEKIQVEERLVSNVIPDKNFSNRQQISKNISKSREKTHENISTNLYKKTQEQKLPFRTINDKVSLSKANIGSEGHIQKVDKLKRPLFYLEPRLTSHIKADSYIVTEYPSGQIILGNYFKKTGQIASLTKIMTFYTVYQIGQKFGKDLALEMIQIDQQAQSVSGTSAQIFVGDTYSVEQLLYGLMLPSGNDAATALAKWGGLVLENNDPGYKADSKNNSNPIKSFIRRMNFMALKCGMKSSKFCNPHGLPHPQSSSNAQDLASLVSECLNIELFRKIIKTKKYSCWVQHNGAKHEVIWQNTHKLLRRPNFIGGKTGVTVTAGPCLASCYQVNNKIFIVIVLRTTKLSRRFKQTRHVLSLALQNLDKKHYQNNIKQLNRNDAQLDSDNSEDQQQFNYDRMDARQIAKRNKILTFQM